MKYISFFCIIVFVGCAGVKMRIQEGNKLDLSNGKINSFLVDTEILDKIIELDISNNNLKMIPAYVFEMVNLQKLNAKGNMINHIPLDIKKLELLSHLNLKENDLGVGVFEPLATLENLRQLILIDNPIPMEEYESGKCLLNDSCLVIISNNFLEYPPYCIKR